ncbi:MAG: DUF637 domain-containing protein, partial [Proteobacteria bacterium]|nr:DUF637 domain-containing protein [Pseudomonadota bacterium]
PTVGGGASEFTKQLGTNLTASVARTVISHGINGGNLEDALRDGLLSAFLDTAAAQTADAIGTLSYGDGAVFNSFTNKVAHALAGCAVGAARTGNGGGCGAGAIGATLGEITGEQFGTDENGIPKPEAAQLANMLGSIGVALAGGDAEQIAVGGEAAANAAVNNAIKHYVDRALDQLNKGLGKALDKLEIDQLVQKQQLIRDYLDGVAARGGFTDAEIAALGVIYAANEALFPTSLLDVIPGGKGVGKAGALIKAGAKVEDAAKAARAEARAMLGANGAKGGVGAAGELTGTRTPINLADDAATIRSLTRENESATTLANSGYKVQQNPPTLPNGKNPDYIVNGQVFDNYAPSTSSVRNAASEIQGKVAKGQTENVVVNLADTTITPAQLQAQLTSYPIPGLKQVVVIDQVGKVVVIKMPN